MQRRLSTAAALIAALLMALPGGASFLASDLIYVPIAAHNPGENESLWRTDVTITNVDSEAVDVVLFFLPTGLSDNRVYVSTRTYALGGREGEGFGFVNTALAAIPPQATVVLEDVVGAYWEPELGEALVSQGALIVLSCEAGQFLAEGGCAAYRNVVVESRTYNQTTIWVPDEDNEGEFVEQAATYGQVMPGVPWYNLADGAAAFEEVDLTYMIVPGAAQNEDYRFNLGVLNASDSQTTIFLTIEAYGPDGQQLVDDEGVALDATVTLPPLAHVQFNRILDSVFDLEDASGITLKVGFADQLAWNTTSPEPFPAFTTYGSLIDNHSNDPTTVLPAFAYPYDVDCMWNPPDAGTFSVREGRSQGRRPFEIPPQ